MAIISFEVKNYQVLILGQRQVGVRNHLVDRLAYIRCVGETDQSLTINFIADEVIPPDYTSIHEPATERAVGGKFASMSEYAWYLDLLRNEGPITAGIQAPNEVDGSAHTNFLNAGMEPVGEGE